MTLSSKKLANNQDKYFDLVFKENYNNMYILSITKKNNKN